MPERPRLHLDFNSPVTPPPIYSPYFTPTSPPSSFTSTPTRRSSTSSTSSSFDSPKTPSTPRIIMGAMVFTPEPKTINGNAMGEGDESDCEEGEMSLEVPGIVLTEPPRPPSPRLPTPPPKQVVLLAPCSLPLPSQQLTSMSTSKDSKIKTPLSFSSSCQQKQGGKPQFSNTFLKLLGHPHSQPSSNAGSRTKRSSLKMILLLSVIILGVWHLWSTLEVGLTIGLVEEASLIL